MLNLRDPNMKPIRELLNGEFQEPAQYYIANAALLKNPGAQIVN